MNKLKSENYVAVPRGEKQVYALAYPQLVTYPI